MVATEEELHEIVLIDARKISSSTNGEVESASEWADTNPEAPLINGESIELGDLDQTRTSSLDTDYAPVTNFKEAKSVCWIESLKLWSIAGPISFNILCVYGIRSITQVFVARIGDVELSAVATSLNVVSTFSFGFLLGMGSALETLCGQAFGAGQTFMLGVYMQRSCIILIGTCIILLPIYIFATPILKFLGQENQIATHAGQFSILIIPHMFSLAFTFPTRKFLQSQRKVGALAWIGFLALIFHTFMLWLFLLVFRWETAGAAVAYNISGWIIALSQVTYTVRYCKDGWLGLSWLAFKDIWPFLRLSVASAVMLCLEVWYMMILVVLSSNLKNAITEVDSISICMNISGLEAMIFLGLNAAISVRVSNELGSGHPRAAKFSVIVVILESLLIGVFCMTVILIFKDYFPAIFTNSKDVQQAVAKLSYVLSVTMILNSVQPVISGVAVGGGWQESVAYINLACYYVFGLPLGFLLGNKAKWGVQGIWIGMLCGIALQTVILFIIIGRTNWKKEVSEAVDRVRMLGRS